MVSPCAAAGAGDIPLRALAAFAFVEKWAKGGRLPDMLAAFADLIRQFGPTMAASAIVVGFGSSRRYRFLFNTWPAELLEHYDADAIFDRDFTIRAALRRHTPFLFREVYPDPQRESDLYRQFESDGARFGIADGFAVPIHSPLGFFGMVTMSSPVVMVLDAAERAALAAAATTIFEHFRRSADAVVERPSITAREQDCMTYVALGRTDDEIAAALGIAPSTVRHHVDNVRSKLGATTRAEAVAFLAQIGEI